MQVKDFLEKFNFDAEPKRLSLSENCFVGEVTTLRKDKEYAKLIEKIDWLLSLDVVEIEHPFSFKKTRPRFTIQQGGTNYIFLSDNEDENVWCWVQSLNVVDAIITSDGQYYDSPTGRNNLRDIKAKILERTPRNALSNSLLGFDEAGFDGLYICHPRPFHFFYDMLLCLFCLSSDKRGVRKIYSKDSFYDLSHFGVVEQHAGACSKNLFLPVAIQRNYIIDSDVCRAKGSYVPEEYKSIVLDFENFVYKKAIKYTGEPSRNSSLKIWYGVTGQKRSWLQQVEAIEGIVNNLMWYFDRVELLVDGLTAPEGKELESAEDESIFLQIEKRLTVKCGVYSLIGKDYRNKIRACEAVDFFIANAGTGCMVPLRFCKKPGVLHSSMNLVSFPDDYPDTVRFFDPKFHVDVPDQAEPKRADYCSYHIPWQHVFNLTAEVLNKIKGTNIKPLEVPPVEDVAKHYDEQQKAQKKKLMAFTAIENRVKPTHKSPDILREVALSFEHSGDIETALKIMQKALELRPTGPFIKKKVIEYQAVIESTNQKVK